MAEKYYWDFVTYGMLGVACLLGVLMAIARISEGGRGKAAFLEILKMLPASSLFILPMIYVGFVAGLAIVAAILGRHFDTSAKAIGKIVPSWLGIWIATHVAVCLVTTCLGLLILRKR